MLESRPPATLIVLLLLLSAGAGGGKQFIIVGIKEAYQFNFRYLFPVIQMKFSQMANTYNSNLKHNNDSLIKDNSYQIQKPIIKVDMLSIKKRHK